MKTILSSLAVAAALSIASIASAAPASAAQDAASESVKISAPRFHIEPSEFGDYAYQRYAYQLSNGETLRFINRVGHYYAQVKGQKRVEIFVAGPAEFVTGNGSSITFTEGGEALTINNYERLSTAAPLPVNTIMMARR